MITKLDGRTREPIDPGSTAPPIGHDGKQRMGAMAVLVALAGGLAACGASASASPSPPGCASGAAKITVEASGQASASPDLLTITMGVSVSGSTASTALSDANGQATNLTNALKASGVPAKDMQSTDLSITPTFSPSGAITGYQVSNTLVVTLHNLSNAGQVVDTAATSAGNAIRINGLTFAVSNTGNVDGQARADAVTTATAHAHAMAAAAGESLVGICSINDSTGANSPLFSGNVVGAPMSASSAVPLEQGTQHASAQVTVVYATLPR
jgi:uncharacterized protein